MFIYIYMRTRKNRKMKRRKTRRRKKGGDTVLENLSKGIGRLKNSMEGIKNIKTGAELAKIYAKEWVGKGFKAGQKAISKMKKVKKITPCTAAAVADRIACSEKYQHTSSAPNWRPPEWFDEKKVEHSEFLGLMCKTPDNISVTLQDGNFDYFRPASHHNEGCHTRTKSKLLKTSKVMDRKNRRKGEEEYLKLSPEERKKRNKEERVFNKEHGIGLVSTQQKQHILAGQKQHVLKRKGRGKKQHWTKKAQKEMAEKKAAEAKRLAEEEAALERMRMPAVGEGPALPPTLSSQGEEKTCAQILKHGPGYTTTSQAEFTRCNNEAKEQEKLVAENQKRRAERKLEQQQKIIQTQKKRRNKPKTKKTFGQQRVVGGKRKRRKTRRKRKKRKTKKRRR